jgi:hypothetical protein
MIADQKVSHGESLFSAAAVLSPDSETLTAAVWRFCFLVFAFYTLHICRPRDMGGG